MFTATLDTKYFMCYARYKIANPNNDDQLPFIVVLGFQFYYAPPSRPEGPRHCPGRGNEGGAFVFFGTFG